MSARHAGQTFESAGQTPYYENASKSGRTELALRYPALGTTPIRAKRKEGHP